MPPHGTIYDSGMVVSPCDTGWLDLVPRAAISPNSLILRIARFFASGIGTQWGGELYLEA